MAQYATILIPQSGDPLSASLASTAATGLLTIGANKKFSVTAVDANLVAVPFQMAIGKVATSTSDMWLPGKWTAQTNGNDTTISIYNPTAASFTYYVALMANA